MISLVLLGQTAQVRKYVTRELTNCVGKSNLMDAISFLIGLESNKLRSSSLRELVYRSINDNPKMGSVSGIYCCEDGASVTFKRV